MKYILILIICIVSLSSSLALDVVWNDTINNATTSFNIDGWRFENFAAFNSNDTCLECPLSMTSTTGGGYWNSLPVNQTIESINEPFIYRAHMLLNSSSQSAVYIQATDNNLTICTLGNCTYWGFHETSNHTSYVCRGNASRNEGSIDLNLFQWYLFEIHFRDASTELYLDGVLERNCTGDGFMNWSQVDRVLIAKETGSNPHGVMIDNVSVLLIGEEEAATITNGTLDVFTSLSETPIIELTALGGTVSDDHNDLSGLQGGTTGQYYHLNFTAFEYLTTSLFDFGFGNGTGSGNLTDTIWNITNSIYLINISSNLDINTTVLNNTIEKLTLNKTEADDLYLNLSGTNANQNVSIGSFNFAANIFFGIGENLSLAIIGDSSFRTIQQLQNLFHSSGVFNENSSVNFILLNPDNTFNVTSGSGTIRSTENATNVLFFFDWISVNNTPISLNEVIYVGVEYNAGSPQVITKSTNTWDMQTDFPLGSIVRDISGVHLQREDHAVGDHANNMIQRLFDTQPFARASRNGGLILGTTGLNITVTSGTLWEKLNEFSISAIDTGSSDTFDRYYRNGTGGWFAQEDNTEWNNTHFDDGTGTLNALGNNKWSIEWVYLEVDGEIVSLFGQEEFNTEGNAEAASPPSSVPSRVEIHARLIGRIIFQESATDASATESVFTTTFTSAGVTDHGNLAGLSDDDHTQYLLIDGTRAMTDILTGTSVSMTGNYTLLNNESCLSWGNGGSICHNGSRIRLQP